jgi:hypothetical protein
LFSADGDVIGVVVSTLSAKYLYERAEALPQNVNFAVKSDYLSVLLQRSGAPSGESKRDIETAALAKCIGRVLTY